MSLPRSVADVISRHVKLEVEGIDRMYLNVTSRDSRATNKSRHSSATIAVRPYRRRRSWAK
jgi:hypothetical protein